MQVLRMRDLVKVTHLSRSTIYALIKRGEFPKQIKLSTRASGWQSSDIERWIESKAEAGR